jgi:hypothetical protein
VQDTFVINSIDSIPYVLRDSIMWERVLVQKDTIVRYKRSYVPKTRLETRIEYKLKRDTIKMLEKVEVVKWKTERNKKTKANLWLFIIGFGAGFLTNWLLKKKHAKNIHELNLIGKKVKIAMLSDIHWDNPKCDWNQLKKRPRLL